jgi:hypothetical protein
MTAGDLENRACEAEGCIRTATVAVQDLRKLYGQGSFPVATAPIGPIHFWCDLHKREPYSFRRVDGKWVHS